MKKQFDILLMYEILQLVPGEGSVTGLYLAGRCKAEVRFMSYTYLYSIVNCFPYHTCLFWFFGILVHSVQRTLTEENI